MEDIKVLAFDTGGTVLDWHAGLTAAFAAWGAAQGIERDWHALANVHRRRSLHRMTNTVDPGFNIDDVHRDVLAELFDENGLGGSAEERQAIAERWHQLDAWPDFAAALRRIRRHHTCVSFTILSLSLIVDVSRRNGIDWDAVIPCEMLRVYKPSCYMAGDRVAGFGHQHIKALIPPPPEGPDSPEAQPGPRIMHGPDAPQFQALCIKVETEWVPQMMEVLDIERASLPIIWDADFLYGPRTALGEDSYVLCEINVSSCFANTGASTGSYRSPCLRSMRIGDQASWMIGAARRGLLVLALSVATASPSIAGPPYVTDDPEPTDTGHWENYLFTEITHVAGQSARPEPGIEINYGAFKDTQLTWSFPLTPNPGPGGIGVVWEPLGGGVKYRFIEEDDNGWRPQVAFFPQVFVPVGSANRGAPVTELFPIWLQKSLGPWTMFGGGGYTNNPGPRNKNFANYGIALQRQVLSNLALGVEVFGQGPDTTTDHGSAAVGVGAIFDFNDLWHLVGSANTGISNAGADQFSFNLALKWTP